MVDAVKVENTGKADSGKTSTDIEKEFKEYSVAEFFKKNRQMLGYSGEVRSLTTIVHEYVTNSLDACEDAKMLPEITVEVEALAAATRETNVGLGDGATQSFEIDDEIARAATLKLTVDGIEKSRGSDYVLKYEKKGKNSFRVISFKTETPRQGAKIVAHWAAGHLRVIVEDNGTGLPKSKVGVALGQLLSGTKFMNREQKRGQQGIGACMKSDTLIPLADGRILPIKTLVDENLTGEKVLALNLKTLKIVPASISQCIRVLNPWFVRVKTSKGREIFLTPENPVLTVRGGKLTWVKIGEVVKGEKIAAPSSLPEIVPQRVKVLSLLNEETLQVDNQELTALLFSELKKKHGSLGKISVATGFNKDVLRNWFTRKMPNGKSRGRPLIKNVFTLAKYAGVNSDFVDSQITRVGRNGTFVNIPLYLNKDVSWLAGLIAGDGHLTSEKDDKWGVGISFHNKNKKLIDEFSTKLSELFNVKYNVLYNEEKEYYTVQTSSSVLAELLVRLGVNRGHKSKTFDIANEIFSNDEFLSSYLRGLFDAEGSVIKRNRSVSLVVYNKKVLEKMFYALLRLGIVSSINKAGDNQNRLMICGKKNLIRFVEKVGFTTPEKNQLILNLAQSIKKDFSPNEMIPQASVMLNNLLGTSKISLDKVFNKLSFSKAIAKHGISQLQVFAESNVNWLEVIDLERVKNEEEFVYDLEIAEHHNFIAGGLIVHNSYATLFSQITTGRPIHVKSSTGDYKIFEADVTIDVKKNIPVVSNEREYSGKFRGLRVEAEFAEVSFDKSEYSVYEYLRRSALSNPHAQFTLIDPSKQVSVFPRASSHIPLKSKPVKPHPLGLSTSDLIDMIHVTQARKLGSFLTGDFAKFSSDKLAELKTMLPHLDLEKHPSKLEWKEAEEIINAFRKIKFYNPDLDALVPIGAEQMEKSLKNLLQPEHLKVIERKPRVFRGGIPFLVEAGIAYGGNAGKDGKGEVMRFANRTPLLFDAGNDAITEAVKTIEWNRYNLKNYEELPVTLMVNFVSVYVPYTGAGKLAISAEEEIVVEIRNALMEAARDISMYLGGLQKAEDAEKRKQIFFKYIGEVAEALEDVTGVKRGDLETKLKKIAEIKTQLLEQEEAGEDGGDLDEEIEKEIQEEG